MRLCEVLLLILPVNIAGFNIDTSNPIVYVDPEKNATSKRSSSYFGYTVVLFPGNKNVFEKWIKIGAPKGQDPKINFRNPGVVYNCPYLQTCTPVDVTGGRSDRKFLLGNAWIGGSMDISYKHERLTICGFRAIYNGTIVYTRRRYKHYFMIGLCYISYLGYPFEAIVPLRNDDEEDENLIITQHAKTTYYYGQGEAGFATHFAKEENAVILGAPGVYNWAGTVVKAVDEKGEDPITSKLRDGRTKRYIASKLYVGNVTSKRTTIRSASNDIFGYSVTSGYYYGRNKLYYAASSPTFDVYKGEVEVFEFQDTALKQKTAVFGNQFGEYFGASTASGDINGDAYDDLIVGAPFHAEKTFNEGAVYVFLGRRAGQLKKQVVLHGQQTNGQFGSAVMFLGDLNNDGYGDLAVGAPYAEDYSGILYIYRGGNEGVDLQPCQRIVGKNVSPEIRGFGISISRPADMDENGSPDIAVGAHLSGNVVLLRSSPVAVVHYVMKSIPQELKQSSKQFLLNICYWYTHFDKEKSIELSRTIQVQEPGSFRNRKDGTKIVTVRARNRIASTCENVTISLMETISYVDSVTVSLSYKLAKKRGNKNVIYIGKRRVTGNDNFCLRCAVLDEARCSPAFSLKVPFSKECASGSCRLTVEAEFPDLTRNTYVVGSSSYLKLKAAVNTSGWRVSFAQLEVTLPELLSFRQTPSECEKQSRTVMFCAVKNSENSLLLELNMDQVNRNYDQKQLNVTLTASSTGSSDYKKQKVLVLDLAREADITITGRSGQQSVSYGNQTYGMPDFTQIYHIEKVGASPLEAVQVKITIPYTVRSSKGKKDFITVYPPKDFLTDQAVTCRSTLRYINDKSESRVRRQAQKQDIVIGAKELEVVPNRTFFLNCSVADVLCASIWCTVGPFEERQSPPAVIQIKMMFDPSAVSHLTGENDMILYTTQGSVTIQAPTDFIQNGNRSDSVEVSSLLINEVPKKRPVPLWIIILAVVAGILLLALIIYGLTKVGFFKRTKKEELENLKAATKNEAGEALPQTLDPAINCSTEGLVDEEVFDPLDPIVHCPTETPAGGDKEE